MFRGHTLTVVEGDGKGEEFIQTIRRNPGLRILALKTGGKRKSARLEKGLQPALASGQVKISDANTPFLNALRKELADYPHSRHDDTMDAVYWALRGMPDVLVGEKVFDELPDKNYKKKSVNPFNSLARA
jgi:phage terminase large subunit-like protein